MVPAVFRRAFVKKGQTIRADNHNMLVGIADQITIQQGRLQGRRDPDGFSPRIEVNARTSSDYAFRISSGTNDQGDLALSFTPSTVGGVMPKIGDLALDDVDENGNPPTITVDDQMFVARGNVRRALVMLRYDLYHVDFGIQSVTPFVCSAPPDPAPWVWNKLVAILVQYNGDIRIWPQIFFPQYFDVTGTKPNGTFQAIPHTA